MLKKNEQKNVWSGAGQGGYLIFTFHRGILKNPLNNILHFYFLQTLIYTTVFY